MLRCILLYCILFWINFGSNYALGQDVNCGRDSTYVSLRKIGVSVSLADVARGLPASGVCSGKQIVDFVHTCGVSTSSVGIENGNYAAISEILSGRNSMVAAIVALPNDTHTEVPFHFVPVVGISSDGIDFYDVASDVVRRVSKDRAEKYFPIACILLEKRRTFGESLLDGILYCMSTPLGFLSVLFVAFGLGFRDYVKFDCSLVLKTLFGLVLMSALTWTVLVNVSSFDRSSQHKELTITDNHLGSLVLGEVGTARILVSNRSSRQIELRTKTISCSCVKVTPLQFVVDAHSDRTIDVSVEATKTGPSSQFVTIAPYERDDLPELTSRISFTGTNRKKVEPRSVNLGVFAFREEGGEPVGFRVELLNGLIASQIKAVRIEDPQNVFNHAFSAALVEDNSVQSHLQIEVRLVSKLKACIVSFPLLFITDSGEQYSCEVNGEVYTDN